MKLIFAVFGALAAFIVYHFILPHPYDSTDLTVTYDYIVVGAGSAGATLASELARRLEREKASSGPVPSVLLLEAGAVDSDFDISIPAASPLLQNTQLDWKYRSVPQKHALHNLKDNVSFWPRGKALGGTSNLNYMIYVRGHRGDFDSWEKNHGASGWGYDAVLPYFKLIEDRVTDAPIDERYRARGGGLTVSDIKTPNHWTTRFVDTASQLGYKIADYNAGEMTETVAHAQLSIRDGRRCSTSKAFLESVPRNLHIATHVHVQRIVFEGKRAVGIEYLRKGQRGVIRANREIILSAGAVGSPHLLLVSGVGDKKHLKETGVPLVHHLPGVGQNLQDHMAFAAMFKIDNITSTTVPLTEAEGSSMRALWDFLWHRKGILTSNGVEAVLFGNADKTGKHKPKGTAPDYQIHFMPATTSLRDMANINFVDKISHNIQNVPYAVHFLPALLHPKSKGSIRLKSADPNEHPLIDPNYLADKDDVDILLAAIRESQRIAAKMGGISVAATGEDIGHPDLIPPHPKDSDDYWRHFIRANSITLYHPVGTCTIGADSDPMAVVDPQLRVRGIENLRVADASVMPTLTSGNTNSPSIMIGARLAHLIEI